MDSITLHGKQFAVEIPEDFATQRELVGAVEQNLMRGCCAIVGYCLPGLGMRGMYQAVGYDALRFGGNVWEKLVKEGVDETELPPLGVDIYKIIRPIAYPGESEVTAAVVFSSPPEEASKEKLSPSSATGGNNQVGSQP